MIYIPSFIKTNSGGQKFPGGLRDTPTDKYTDRKQDDVISSL
jgi:hypothetical protein